MSSRSAGVASAVSLFLLLWASSTTRCEGQGPAAAPAVPPEPLIAPAPAPKLEVSLQHGTQPALPPLAGPKPAMLAAVDEPPQRRRCLLDLCVAMQVPQGASNLAAYEELISMLSSLVLTPGGRSTMTMVATKGGYRLATSGPVRDAEAALPTLQALADARLFTGSLKSDGDGAFNAGGAVLSCGAALARVKTGGPNGEPRADPAILVVTADPLSRPAQPMMAASYALLALAAATAAGGTVAMVPVGQDANTTLLQAASSNDHRSVPLTFPADDYSSLGALALPLSEALCTAASFSSDAATYAAGTDPWRGGPRRGQRLAADTYAEHMAPVELNVTQLRQMLSQTYGNVVKELGEAAQLGEPRPFQKAAEVMLDSMQEGEVVGWRQVVFGGQQEQASSAEAKHGDATSGDGSGGNGGSGGRGGGKVAEAKAGGAVDGSKAGNAARLGDPGPKQQQGKDAIDDETGAKEVTSKQNGADDSNDDDVRPGNQQGWKGEGDGGKVSLSKQLPMSGDELPTCSARPTCRLFAEDVACSECVKGKMGLFTDSSSFKVWIICGEDLKQVPPAACVSVEHAMSRKPAGQATLMNDDAEGSTEAGSLEGRRVRQYLIELGGSEGAKEGDKENEGSGGSPQRVVVNVEAKRADGQQCALRLRQPCALDGRQYDMAEPVEPLSIVIDLQGGRDGADAPNANKAKVGRSLSWADAEALAGCRQQEVSELPQGFFKGEYSTFNVGFTLECP